MVDAETGLYKRHWGAYGQNPVDDAAADAVGPYAEDRDAGITPGSTSAIRCTACAITKDGKVYVCDRVNNRIQVFDKTSATMRNPFSQEGECGFVNERHPPDTLGSGSVWDLDTSADRRQSCLHNADGTNQVVDTHRPRELEILDDLRPQRPQRRPVPLGAQPGHRLGRQHLHRRGRYR